MMMIEPTITETETRLLLTNTRRWLALDSVSA